MGRLIHDLFILISSRYSAQLGSLSHCHVLREANHMADNLAKQGIMNRVCELKLI